jgi:hypothetical protein
MPMGNAGFMLKSNEQADGGFVPPLNASGEQRVQT